MATAHATPRDPLRTYQYRVRLRNPNGIWTDPIAGVQRISGLSCSIGTHEVWEGGNNYHPYVNPDRVTWEPITLEQGLALNRTLEDWAKACLEFAMGGIPPRGQAIKRDVMIEVWSPYEGPKRTRQPADLRRAYAVTNAWVSRFEAMPQLDAMASQVALLSVELVHEGFTSTSPEQAAVHRNPGLNSNLT